MTEPSETPTLESPRAEEMVQGLRDAGLKLTPQRLAIVREIADDPSHPTAQELYERLQAAMPTMSFATVYNTLSAFAEVGLVTPRSLTAGATRFDPNTNTHDHAVCDGCGDVVDIRAQDESPASVPSGFRVRAVERVYRGLCARCAAS